jgi:hypothetical protein
MFTRAKDILSKNKVVEIIITLIASSSLFSLFIIHSVFSVNLLSLLNEILILVFTGLLLVILFIIIVINKFLRRIERQINSFIEIEMLKDIYLSICRTR